jgi:N4-gp56 family major capsid protein
MAGPYTGGPTTVASSLDYDQTAWELKAYYALRPELYFDDVADVQTTDQSYNGAAVTFTIQSDLAIASTALNESTDVVPVAMADSQVTLTLAEYGNALQISALELGTTFIPLDPIMANVVGFNAGISLDTLARDTLKVGTNVRYSLGTGVQPTARNQVTPANTLGAQDVRRSLADLRGANVPTIGGLYVAFIHSDVAFDLRGTTGSAAWRDPHTYSQPGEIWNGEVGVFEGFRFIETPRAPLFVDQGSSTTLTDVYRTLFLGRQALAKTWSTTNGNGEMPRIYPTPIIDLMRRFPGMAWYWLGQYGIFRQPCLRSFESASSIGNN